jgi:uncharacterized protein (DUF302 family)
MENAGLILVTSSLSVPATVERFVASAKQAGLTIFGQRDYLQGVQDANRPRAAILVVFGNPNVIARLIAAKQQVGIDLPMKALIWEDPDGNTIISCTDPRWVISRHGLSAQFGELSNKMAALLEKVIKSAASEQTVQ